MEGIKCAVPVCTTKFAIKVVRELIKEIPNLIRIPQQRNSNVYQTPKKQRDTFSSFEVEDNGDLSSRMKSNDWIDPQPKNSSQTASKPGP